MTLTRAGLGRPLTMATIDYNSAAAFKAAGEPLRTYPGMFPIPDTTLAWSGEPLTLLSWQRTLRVYPELVLIVGRDVAVGEAERAEDAVLGYSLGLGIWDNAMVADLKRGTARDIGVNTLYGYFIDGSKRQSKHIFTPDELPPVKDLTLTLRVPGKEPLTSRQAGLINDGAAVLREASRILPFHRGDVVCLGPAAAPLILPPEERLPAGGEIRVSGSPFADVVVPVDDQRDPEQETPWPGRKA